MKKVLIIEDEPDMLEMIKMSIEGAGHEALTAVNGLKGLEQVKENLPDLIISDVLMPEMDGFHFYKELKNSKVTANIPVLILTARGKMEDAFRVIGVDEFMAKPFKNQELIEKVEILLSRIKSKGKASAAKRVLVAGPEEEVIENMVLQLKQVGSHTDLVTTGAQVISKAVLFLPEILVIDVLMDDMETHEIVRIIRAMPQVEKIPILLYSFYRLSDLGSEDVRQRALSVDTAEKLCLEAGATEYIGRFSENVFMKYLNKYLVK